MTDLTFDESGTGPAEDPPFTTSDAQITNVTTGPGPWTPAADVATASDAEPFAPDVDVVPASDEQTDAIERELERAPADPPAFPHVALADGDVATAIPMGEERSHGGHRVKRHIIHNGVDYHPGDTIDVADEQWDAKSVESLTADGAIEPDPERMTIFHEPLLKDPDTADDEFTE
jgi:hypothetical protein